jgi:hypothetical protein
VKSGPGLAKTRGAPLVSLRRGNLARGNDAAWRALFEEADTVSEGSARAEGERRVFYGTTSLILVISPLPSARTLAFLAAFAAKDLHVRLRALRAACREAALRAPSGARLGSSRCEIVVVSDSRGLRIDVDVQAPLIEGGAARRRRPHGP